MADTYACLRLKAIIRSAISGCAPSLSLPFLEAVAVLVCVGSCMVEEERVL